MIDRACISLNSNCNLKCKYCHFKGKQEDFNSFNYKELVKIIDNIHIYCNKNSIDKFKLGIVGSGEPMLNSQLIFDIVKYIIKLGYEEFKMYTITNGTLLSEKILKQFYEYKDYIKICISLDSYKEIHNNGRMQFDKVMASVNNYKKIFKTSPSINSTVNKLFYKNKEKVIEFYKSNELYDVTFSKLVGYLEEDLFITDNEYQDFMKYALENGIKSRQFIKDNSYDCIMYGKLCGVGRTNIFITPEGIYPCGRFYKDNKYLLGTFDTPLFDVDINVKRMKPVENGKCYYIENVERG